MDELIWASEDVYDKGYPNQYIIGACTVYKGIKFIGMRHSHSMRQASTHFNEPIRGAYGDGFIDNHMNFLTRQEALILAKKNGQFKGHSGSVCDILYSEDLW